jgi:methylated-DNA-protein-cysteine methyltransferase-like protein
MVKAFGELKPETQAILREIKNIPHGEVLSDRDIGNRAGLVNGARQVARALHGLSEIHELPWWRVIRSDGKIGLHGAQAVEQIRLLQLEGHEFTNSGKIIL